MWINHITLNVQTPFYGVLKSTINLDSGSSDSQPPATKTISDTDPRPSRRLPTRKSSVKTDIFSDPDCCCCFTCGNTY